MLRSFASFGPACSADGLATDTSYLDFTDQVCDCFPYSGPFRGTAFKCSCRQKKAQPTPEPVAVVEPPKWYSKYVKPGVDVDFLFKILTYKSGQELLKRGHPVLNWWNRLDSKNENLDRVQTVTELDVGSLRTAKPADLDTKMQFFTLCVWKEQLQVSDRFDAFLNLEQFDLANEASFFQHLFDLAMQYCSHSLPYLLGADYAATVRTQMTQLAWTRFRRQHLSDTKKYAIFQDSLDEDRLDYLLLLLEQDTALCKALLNSIRVSCNLHSLKHAWDPVVQPAPVLPLKRKAADVFHETPVKSIKGGDQNTVTTNRVFLEDYVHDDLHKDDPDADCDSDSDSDFDLDSLETGTAEWKMRLTNLGLGNLIHRLQASGCVTAKDACQFFRNMNSDSHMYKSLGKGVVEQLGNLMERCQ